ncbi:hypothetical protein LTR10_020148 [Elasticomyces elasticus]|uniref:C2H2-type domain-containing protein n=1 Tax=Exophiala sideris TaxID=1016849 RepID=A0ABR0IVV7_9EURO|nr:hypothetical protein LTR10_020148 [Elasticomyces elasticus]KAK5021609.1 hypothetical protein LTS07_010906 [Exophiala sideris]KAK5024758.1 hypothetical protein LTR13_010727 [Exophiala sideris]KAK5049746.1 hypothetical protein LTR69_010930 [Exophiala sideris]KAK5176727.1 hypothetical protein LTR44_010797 [Eurotiomycetes sp. CCFEE 6388]
MTDSVSTISIECLKRLSNVASREQLAHLDAEVHHMLWNDELGRLRVWAANIRAYQSGQTSLDYRLRDASHIREQTVKLLQRLRRLLGDIDDLLAEAPSHTGVPALEKTDDEDEDEDDDAADNGTELQQIYHGLVDTINCLHQISVVIRRPTKHDRIVGIQKADITPFELFDRAHVAQRYPGVEQVLTDRLGSAISRRRATLIYRERHHAKLGKVIDRTLHDGEDAVATQLSETIATDYEQPQGEDDRSEGAVSETSCASSLSESSNKTTIPRPPKESAGQRPFECPYCFYTIRIPSRRSWVEHVLEDLMAYSDHPSKLATDAEGECPLRCGALVTAALIVKHVGRHLEDLALFALPQSDSNDEERSGQSQVPSSPDSLFDDDDHDRASVDEAETLVRTDQAPPRPPDRTADYAETDACEKLQDVDDDFHDHWLPECKDFISNTPLGPEERRKLHIELRDSVTTQVILKAEAIDVITEEERASRDDFLEEVHETLRKVEKAAQSLEIQDIFAGHL